MVTQSAAPIPSLSRKDRNLLFVHVFLLMLLYNVALTGVSGVALQFILKDTLHLKPQQIAVFGFLADAPYFVAFAFGFLSDRWQPFHRGARGYFLLLPPLLACARLLLAFAPFTYSRIITASLLMAVCSVWLGAAVSGLMTIIAQYRGMAGRFTVVMLLTPRLVSMAASAIGGWLAVPTLQHTSFLISATLCLPLMLMAFWVPRVVFTQEVKKSPRPVPEGTLDALKRLARHRSVYLPAAILFLWSFAPGWGTPLFFYMTNTVKLSEKVYGYCGAIQGGGMLFTILAYTGLCYWVRLRPLLWWGTLFGTLGCPVFLLAHSPMQAYIVYFLAGASLGIALCAYNDLLFRCCPKQLEGAAMMFTTAMSYIAGDTSDIFGSWLYEKGGFMMALIVSTLFTGLIFVVLPFIPHKLTAPPEGEPLRKDESLIESESRSLVEIPLVA